MQWDIFCRVIDNHGDLGVCWRLAQGLVARGQQVRLVVDDASALSWLGADALHAVNVLPWGFVEGVGNVVVEAFACHLPLRYQAAMAAVAPAKPVWLNLEYLSAESYVARNHKLLSPVLLGPSAGLRKNFFYPGFTSGTGGLLREAGLLAARDAFDRQAWLARLGINVHANEQVLSLFCYEPAALPDLLAQLSERPTLLLVTAGRAAAAVRRVKIGGQLRIAYLPLLSQLDYDHLLWAADINFVRGEDSLVRALWAGKPFVWQAYVQEEEAHLIKVQALMQRLAAPDAVQDWHLAWNTDAGLGLPSIDALCQAWPTPASTIQALEQLPDLVSQLLNFVAEAQNR